LPGLSTSFIIGIDSRYKFRGNELEDDLGLNWVHFPLRRYDPQIGRWTGVDPYDECFSPYVYCGGNPVNYSDPSGGNLVVTRQAYAQQLMKSGREREALREYWLNWIWNTSISRHIAPRTLLAELRSRNMDNTVYDIFFPEVKYTCPGPVKWLNESNAYTYRPSGSGGTGAGKRGENSPTLVDALGELGNWVLGLFKRGEKQAENAHEEGVETVESSAGVEDQLKGTTQHVLPSITVTPPPTKKMTFGSLTIIGSSEFVTQVLLDHEQNVLDGLDDNWLIMEKAPFPITIHEGESNESSLIKVKYDLKIAGPKPTDAIFLGIMRMDIFYNPTGASDDGGGKTTPARIFGLYHEEGHAAKGVKEDFHFWYDSNTTSGDRFDTEEDKRNIKEVENAARTKLGYPIRSDHYTKLINSKP
jgi:RHS repeat-associated protein